MMSPNFLNRTEGRSRSLGTPGPWILIPLGRDRYAKSDVESIGTAESPDHHGIPVAASL